MTKQRNEKPSPSQHFDALSGCLVYLTKHYGRPMSEKVLKAGLPLRDGHLTPRLFLRAAERGGLSAKLVHQKLNATSQQLFPVVVILQNQRAIVVLNVDEEKQTATVVLPELPNGQDDIALSEIAEQETGWLYFVRRTHRFDDRAKDSYLDSPGHWFWKTIRRSMPYYRDALLASLFISAFAVVMPLYVMNVYDRVVPNQAFETLWVLTIGITIILVFDFALKQARAHLVDLAAKKSDVLLSAQIFEKLMRVDKTTQTSSIGAMSRSVQEFDSVRDFITSSTILVLVDIPFTLLIFWVVWFVAGNLVIVPIAIALALVCIGLLAALKLKQSAQVSGQFQLAKNAHLIETLSGIDNIKIYSAESQFQRSWENLSGATASNALEQRSVVNTVTAGVAMLSQATTVAIILLGTYGIAMGSLSMGGLIAAVMLSTRAIGPYGQAAMLVLRSNQARSALQSLENIMSMPEEQATNYLHRGYYSGRIDVDKISFNYPEASHHTLRNVSFSISPGEKVAIIGRIGSGKTTLQYLLAGLYKPNEGAIRIDGIDYQQINASDLRQKIACMRQDVELFYGSIRDNITLGAPHVEDERILRAAKLAGVTLFTDRDKDGLDKQVGERGHRLSGGQRQAVLLARTLLFSPPVMILDEPTSQMDSVTERMVQMNLEKVAQDRTFVLITHKSSMLSLVDRVIVVDHGEILEDGPKEEVLGNLKSGGAR